MESSKFREIIDFAIERETEAFKFYREAGKRADRTSAKTMFRELASEEQKHEKLLRDVKGKGMDSYEIKSIPDLKIGDYLSDLTYNPGMGYQEILIMAIKREERSHNLYNDMLRDCSDADLRKLLEFLAQEEAKHKLRLETEYDDVVLSEN
ncbi:MAG: ferritin-like domain-containing protein [bacterium]